MRTPHRARDDIRVNERLETTAPDVWAMGDCSGSPRFTDASFDDFRIVRDNLNGGSRSTRPRLVPFCMFTDPELARVGLNENEARARGLAYRTAHLQDGGGAADANYFRAPRLHEDVDRGGSDHILGFTVFGAEASELMARCRSQCSALFRSRCCRMPCSLIPPPPRGSERHSLR